MAAHHAPSFLPSHPKELPPNRPAPRRHHDEQGGRDIGCHAPVPRIVYHLSSADVEATELVGVYFSQTEPVRMAGVDVHRPDSRIHKALAHPLRLEILAALGEPGAVLAPSELARQIDLPVQKLNYHFTVLAEAGMIELAGTEPVRGAIKHFYRASRNAPTASSPAWPAPPESPAKPAVAAKSLSAYFEAAREAIAAGAFERRDGVRFSWGRIELDAKGMAKMPELLAGFLDRLVKLEEECAARIEAGKTPIEAIYAIGGFESPSAQRPARGGRVPGR